MRFGCREPRIFTPPLRPLEPRTPETEARTLGYAVIDFARDVMKQPLFPWQEFFFIHALELRSSGRGLRFKTVLLLVARQNGKSTISQVLGLFVLYILQWKLVLGTAQDLDTAEEVLDGAIELAQETAEDADGEDVFVRPELADQVDRVNKTNGKHALQLKGRRRWKVKAAGRGAGRGFSGDLVMFDELREQRNWLAWNSVSKTTMARPNSLIFCLSNAGDIQSVVLRQLRRVAHMALGDPDNIAELSDLERFMLGQDAAETPGADDADGSTLGIFEWSAVPGLDKRDRDGWAQANPSMGHLIDERDIANACLTDPEWGFRTEVLCQWPDGAIEQPYPPGAWDACANTPAEGPTGPILAAADTLHGPLFACVDVTDDNSRAHVVVAGLRDDGIVQVEHRASRIGTHWVEGFLMDPKVKRRIGAVAGQERGAPVSALLADLEASGDFTIPILKWGGQDMLNSYVDFEKAVVGRDLRHNAQPGLDAAAQTAARRRLGGVDVIDRRGSVCDASPLIAAIGAVWLLKHPPPPVAERSMPPLPEVAVATLSVTSAKDLASISF